MPGTRNWIVGAAVLVGIVGMAATPDAPKRIEGWGVSADPDGDCTFRPDPATGSLTINVPGSDRAHLLSAEEKALRLNAPRVLRPARGDFVASVTVAGTLDPGFEPTSTYAPYHGAGLLVFQDKGSYVRLERAAYAHDGTVTPYINFEVRRDDRLASTRRIDCAAGVTSLRLSRRGDSFHASFSLDGRRWTPFPTVSAPFTPTVEVGVAAINASRRPLRVELNGFKVDAGGEDRPANVPPPPPPGPAVPSRPPTGSPPGESP